MLLRIRQVPGLTVACVAVTSALFAQTLTGAQPGVAVAQPTYVAIPMQMMVDRPAAEVWVRVGKYCDIAEWLRIPCTITAGTDGEVGAVRLVADVFSEVLVGKTDLSYTYAMAPRESSRRRCRT